VLDTILIILSGILTLVSVVPYLRAIIKGTTKPRVVTWLVWSILTGIAAAATFSDGQYPTAILLTFATIATLSVVVVGWHRGDKKIERLDIACLIAAFAGIVLWQVFNAPAIAVIATIAIDFVGGIPTLIHAWKKPHEETAITFFLWASAGLCTLIVVSHWTVTSAAYPLFLVAMNIIIATIIIIGQKRSKVR
jgi:hypothetical protein